MIHCCEIAHHILMQTEKGGSRYHRHDIIDGVTWNRRACVEAQHFNQCGKSELGIIIRNGKVCPPDIVTSTRAAALDQRLRIHFPYDRSLTAPFRWIFDLSKVKAAAFRRLNFVSCLSKQL
jgi:hypothetical protein